MTDSAAARLPDAGVPHPPDPPVGPALGRLVEIDTLRGLVIVLMVLDHVRDFFSAPVDALALDSGDPVLFLTRWITHLCAPTFVLLAGVSVWLQAANGKSRGELSRFLATRGVWLIFLEVAVIGIGFNLGWWIFLQVIWAIGFGMLVLSGLVWLPRGWVLVLGVALILFHPLLATVSADGFGPLELVWRALATFGPAASPAGPVLVAYPALPWLGVLLLGYGLGPIFSLPPRVRRAWIVRLIVGSAIAFLVLRGLNVAGFDPRPWSVQTEGLWTVFSFINVSKYPPSPAFVLLMLALSLSVFLALERLPSTVAGVLCTFGRTPLFTYLVHIWMAHLLAVVVGMAMGVPAKAFANSLVRPEPLIAAGWGFPLAGVYLATLAVLIALYPLSRWFAGVRRRRKTWWLSYL